MQKLKKKINIFLLSKLLSINNYYLVENSTNIKNKIYTKTLSKKLALLNIEEIKNLKFPISIRFFNNVTLIQDYLKYNSTNFVLVKKNTYYFVEQKILIKTINQLSLFFHLKKSLSSDNLLLLLK